MWREWKEIDGGLWENLNRKDYKIGSHKVIKNLVDNQLFAVQKNC